LLGGNCNMKVRQPRGLIGFKKPFGDVIEESSKWQ